MRSRPSVPTPRARRGRPTRRSSAVIALVAIAALVSVDAAAARPAAAEGAPPTPKQAAQPSAAATAAAPRLLGASYVLNAASGKCIDTPDGGRDDGLQLQQWQCYDGSVNQHWEVTDAGDGFVTIALIDAPTSVLAAPTAAAAAPVQLATADGNPSQQWRAAANADGSFELRSRLDDSLCMTLADGNLANGARLVLGTCADAAVHRFRFVENLAEDPWKVSNPFGPSVTVIDRTWLPYAIQAKVDAIFADQQTAQFGNRRDAVIFAPGTYDADISVGFNTQILGAGLLPGDVTINGHVGANADWWDGIDDNAKNSTQNFWRGAENLSVNPTDGTEMWAVSQAAPYRRMQINGDLLLAQPNGAGARCGWASGGLLADSKVTGTVDSCTQQQYFTRNSEVGAWTGTNWNLMFQGTTGAPEPGVFDETKYTVIDETPLSREKPFVYLDGADWKVFVPALRTDSVGTSWADGTPEGESKPLSDFYLVKPGDTAKTINAQLQAGKDLIITPGVYKLDRALKITRPDTVVLGLGLANLRATKGNALIEVADVDGVKIAGLMLDAGAKRSDVLLQVGDKKAKADHSANPTSLHDVYVRVGGNWEARVSQAVVINSDDVIGDHLWIWRADHSHNADDGFAPDWKNTTSDNGLVVRGDDVSMYGLFVEHFQQYQTLWNGERGKTFFYQNETPYDAPTQKAWMDGKKNGWAAYKVSDKVKEHQAIGLGSYAVYFGPGFSPSPFEKKLFNSFETPTGPGISFEHMVTVAITGGIIEHIINGEGPATPPGVRAVTMERYPE